MRVLMKKSVDGARDGMRTETFHEGQSYDFSDEMPREAELAGVFLREGWAEKAAPAPIAQPQGATDDRPVYRLPLVDEFLAAGYKPEEYDEFLKKETAGAEAAGFRVEIRAKNEAELALELKDRDEHAAREAQIDKERAQREALRKPELPAAAAPHEAAPTPPVHAEAVAEAPPAPATPPETPKSKHASHKPSKGK
jgi:hypothetical protein